MLKKILFGLLAAVLIFSAIRVFFLNSPSELNLDQLSPSQMTLARNILEKTKPIIDKNEREGTLPVLSREEFYAPLSNQEKELIGKILRLDPKALGVKTPFLGILNTSSWDRIDNQQILRDGKPFTIPAVYLSPEVHKKYSAMMDAMEKETGKRLYLESGYRSPTYQLYGFLYYMVTNHKGSLRRTASLNALPGYSEHGYPPTQALDFVSVEGISGDWKPEVFEKLPEYHWLVKRAGDFDFEISYPKDNALGMAFELWHWRQKWGVLSDSEKQILKGIQGKWLKWVPKKQEDGSVPLMQFKELYEGLTAEEQNFLNRVRAVRPVQIQELPPSELQKIEGQVYTKDGKQVTIGAQYLPKPVFEANEKMMAAMKKDLGKRLLVDSGYRSPAYQLYLFLFYLPKHDYSVSETRRWVGLPGTSEHGKPERQAIDFISDQGVSGENEAEEFESLPEYAWLQVHAAEYGFELSYPRGHKDTTFEPWHWRKAVSDKR